MDYPGSPAVWQQFFEPFHGVFSDAAEDIPEPGLRRKRGSRGAYRLCAAYWKPAFRSMGLATTRCVRHSLYLRDPDGNGVELYWDRPQELWPRNENGDFALYTRIAGHGPAMIRRRFLRAGVLHNTRFS